MAAGVTRRHDGGVPGGGGNLQEILPFLRVLGSPMRGSMAEVIISENENFERALRRFKKKCEKAGILSDLRKHRHYEKPSERRKRKLNAARRKQRRSR